jgi:hypothetical protein
MLARKRYTVYEDRRLCKKCYQRFRAGKDTQFDIRVKPTVQSLWDFQQLLANLVPVT